MSNEFETESTGEVQGASEVGGAFQSVRVIATNPELRNKAASHNDTMVDFDLHGNAVVPASVALTLVASGQAKYAATKDEDIVNEFIRTGAASAASDKRVDTGAPVRVRIPSLSGIKGVCLPGAVTADFDDKGFAVIGEQTAEAMKAAFPDLKVEPVEDTAAKAKAEAEARAETEARAKAEKKAAAQAAAERAQKEADAAEAKADTAEAAAKTAKDNADAAAAEAEGKEGEAKTKALANVKKLTDKAEAAAKAASEAQATAATKTEAALKAKAAVEAL